MKKQYVTEKLRTKRMTLVPCYWVTQGDYGDMSKVVGSVVSSQSGFPALGLLVGYLLHFSEAL